MRPIPTDAARAATDAALRLQGRSLHPSVYLDALNAHPVTTRRRIRIDVDLPDLTPAQAGFLWNFLDDLASDLWDAYERELLECEDERSRPHDAGHDLTAEGAARFFEDRSLTHDLINDEEPEPEF